MSSLNTYMYYYGSLHDLHDATVTVVEGTLSGCSIAWVVAWAHRVDHMTVGTGGSIITGVT